MNRFVIAFPAALALVVAPELALACAVCGGGQTEEVRYAFLWTTGLLSALRLGRVGGVGGFLRRRARELADGEAARRAAPEAAALRR